MEIYSSSVEDQLIDGLSYKLAAGSSYITDRRSVSFFPSGSNIYTPSGGTKVLRFLINGSDWLDPNTLRIFFDLSNLENYPLRVLGNPYSFFRRMRVLVGNQLVEDIDQFNRVSYMFDTLRARHVRENEDCEGFEDRFDQPEFQDILTNNSNNPAYPTTTDGRQMDNVANYYVSVKANGTKTVSFRPLSGLVSCGKLIPLQYAPITIELEVCSDITDPIMSVDDVACNINSSGTGTANSGVKNNSQLWQIQNPNVKCDVCVLDSALNNEYAALLLSGKALPINISSYVMQMQTISGQTPSVNITRALSRLKSVFCTFDQAISAAKYAVGTDTHIRVWKKTWNDFFHPMSYSVSGHYDNAFEVETQLQIGSKLFPEYPVRSLQEQFYQLRKCMGTETSNFHSLDITPTQYRNHKFVAAFDTEKNLGSAFTGLNIKQGSLMTLKMRSTATSSQMPDTVYLVLHFDSIVSITDSGVNVFE